MSDQFLSIRQVRKAFGPTVVVQEFNLDVKQGEFVSFLGPSGCGKTTMLRIVAGFEEPSVGQVFIGGKDVTHLKPNQRNIGMVFQAYALFPNMTVAGNIGFGLKVAGRPSAEIRARVAEMLDLIKLPELGDRYPYQLSGGQQQRVALARAWRRGRRCCCSTSRFRRLTPRCACRCARRSGPSRRSSGSPRCS
jgi:putative spermidine/putrescine transport system ATP-binding protein